MPGKPSQRTRVQVWSSRIPDTQVLLAPQQAKHFNKVIKWAVSKHVDLGDFMKVWELLARAPQIMGVYEHLLNIQEAVGQKPYTTVYEIIEAGFPEATIYRAIRRLRELGLVACVGFVPKFKGSRGGPRPSIWMAI